MLSEVVIWGCVIDLSDCIHEARQRLHLISDWTRSVCLRFPNRIHSTGNVHLSEVEPIMKILLVSGTASQFRWGIQHCDRLPRRTFKYYLGLSDACGTKYQTAATAGIRPRQTLSRFVQPHKAFIVSHSCSGCTPTHGDSTEYRCGRNEVPCRLRRTVADCRLINQP
jgi:hypothetical protein